MEKKLPKVFANKIEKDIRNNERVYYEKNNLEKIEVVSSNVLSNEFSINQKINRIFGSSRYIYKALVKIKYKNGNVVDKKIIARNKSELITMDNELIKISDIDDIEFSDS